MLNDDVELVKRVVIGDKAAAGEFVDRFHRLIYSLLTRDLGLSPSHADDVFQTVFVKLWEDNYRRLRQWQGRGSLVGYLTVIVRRLAYDYLRKRQISGEGGDDPPTGRPDPGLGSIEISIAKERGAALRQTLDLLSERDRELIILKHERGMTYQQIGTVMGMTVNNVGVALSRAEARLRQILQMKYPDLFADEGVITLAPKPSSR